MGRVLEASPRDYYKSKVVLIVWVPKSGTEGPQEDQIGLTTKSSASEHAADIMEDFKGKVLPLHLGIMFAAKG